MGGLLRARLRSLAEFLRSLSEEQWSGSTGVLLEGEELTIRQNVDWLIEDHHHHSEQLRDLAKGSVVRH